MIWSDLPVLTKLQPLWLEPGPGALVPGPTALAERTSAVESLGPPSWPIFFPKPRCSLFPQQPSELCPLKCTEVPPNPRR